MGHMGGLINPAPGAEDAEPVIQIPVGLPCLERGRLVKKNFWFSFWVYAYMADKIKKA